MKVPKKIDLAVKTIKKLDMVNPKRVADLATEVGTTMNFLEQITRRLRMANLIKAHRGPGGGYVAVQGKVTLYDVSKALQYTDQEMSGLDGELLNIFKSWTVRDSSTNTEIPF